MKAVTVVIPVFNEEESLGQLFVRLQQVIERRQDLAWKLLFVNDGSVDRTTAILDDLALRYPYCQVIPG